MDFSGKIFGRHTHNFFVMNRFHAFFSCFFEVKFTFDFKMKLHQISF